MTFRRHRGDLYPRDLRFVTPLHRRMQTADHIYLVLGYAEGGRLFSRHKPAGATGSCTANLSFNESDFKVSLRRWLHSEVRFGLLMQPFYILLGLILNNTTPSQLSLHLKKLNTFLNKYIIKIFIYRLKQFVLFHYFNKEFPKEERWFIQPIY